MPSAIEEFDITRLEHLAPNVWFEMRKDTVKFFRVKRGKIRSMEYAHQDIINFYETGKCRKVAQKGVPDGFAQDDRRVFYLPGDKMNPRHGFSVSRTILDYLHKRITNP